MKTYTSIIILVVLITSVLFNVLLIINNQRMKFKLNENKRIFTSNETSTLDEKIKSQFGYIYYASAFMPSKYHYLYAAYSAHTISIKERDEELKLKYKEQEDIFFNKWISLKDEPDSELVGSQNTENALNLIKIVFLIMTDNKYNNEFRNVVEHNKVK